MAVIKQACPKCGQRVSGDESFYGTSVECPICSSKIFFPDPDPPAEDTRKAEQASPPPLDKSRDAPSGKPLPPLDESFEDRQADQRTSSIPLQAPTAVGVATSYSEPPSATLSIISMVLGILNAVTFCGLAIILAPAAIICGHIALIKGKFSPIQPAPGRSMAITGLILGYLGLAVMLIVLVLMVSGVFDIVDFVKDRGASESE